MRIFRLSDWTVQPDTGTVTRREVSRRLQPKVMDVLVYLAEHPGEVLSKERLIQAVWPDLFVTDWVLSRAISDLRKSLGDDAANPRYIQTLPKRGYRLIAEVEYPGPDKRPKNPVRVKFALLFVLLAFASGLAFWPTLVDQRTESPQKPEALRQTRSSGRSYEGTDRLPEQKTLRAVPFTTFPGYEVTPRISPDGNHVAFSWDGPQQDNYDIYVKAVGPGEPIRLTDHAARDSSPAWSPDGNSIAFCRNLGESISVIKKRAFGGAEMVVAVVAIAGPFNFNRTIPHMLEWSPDGEWLALASPGPSRAVLMLSIETGKTWPATTPASGVFGDRFPRFSPDGQALAFVRDLSQGSSDVYLSESVDLSSRSIGRPRRLTTVSQIISGMTWTPDGRRLICSLGPAYARHMVEIDISDPGTTRALPLTGIGLRAPSMSRRGNRLIYGQRQLEVNIWASDLPGPSGPSNPPRKLIASTTVDRDPALSPDGNSMAFSSWQSGAHEVWVSNLDGSGPSTQLTFFGGGAGGAPRWSPDGKRIAFDHRESGQAEIYVVDADGRNRPRRRTFDEGSNATPSWSEDGWIYFISDRTGEFQIWKVPGDGGDAEQVTVDGGYHQIVSRDGDFLFFLREISDPQGHGIWKMPVTGGNPERIVEKTTSSRIRVTSNGLYYWLGSNEDNWQLYRYDFSTEESSLQIEIDKTLQIWGWDISDDGKTVYYPQVDKLGFDLWLVEDCC